MNAGEGQCLTGAERRLLSAGEVHADDCPLGQSQERGGTPQEWRAWNTTKVPGQAVLSAVYQLALR